MSGLPRINMVSNPTHKPAKFALIVAAFTTSMTANAMLLDCSKDVTLGASPDSACAPVEMVVRSTPVDAVKEVVPPVSPAGETVAPGFYVGQLQPSASLHGSTLLIGLICALLGVVLFRTRSYNSK